MITKEDLHFWEKYWVFIVSVISGVLIGFGLGGKQVSDYYPILAVSWIGLPCFHLFFTKVRKVKNI